MVSLNRTISSRQTDKLALLALVGLLREAPRRNVLLVFTLMLTTALTEGIGIMLLVPILTVTGQTGQSASQLSGLLDGFGLQHTLGILLCLFVVLIALRALLQYFLQEARNRLEFSVVDGLRANCFNRLVHVEWRWMAQGRASDFSALLITNIARVGSGLTSAIQLTATSLVAIAYLATAFILSWQTALVVVVGGLVVIIGFSGLRRRVAELGHDFGLANKAMHQQVQEGVAAIRMTKLTSNEERQTTTFAKVVDTVRRQQLAYSRQSMLGQAALQIGGAVLLSTIVYIGLELWHVQIPILLPLLLVSIRLVPILGALQQGWHYWLHAVPALDEIQVMLVDLEQNAEPVEMNVDRLELTQAITLNSVSLLYAGRTAPALDAISLTIPANQTTAIIGASGSGKSSLADIVTGIIEPDQGVFAVDDIPIVGTKRRQWRRSLSYVQQDAFLFHESVRDNLLWASPNASEAELNFALTTAAADFVFALPDGLNTIVGDGGVRLSGGERQRIALARALLCAPTLLILDEATSALDPANEAAIRLAIANLRGNMTIILIGHRLAMLDQADQVIELWDGQILRQGSSAAIFKGSEVAA